MNMLYPIFAMMALTIFAMVRLGYLRYQAVSKHEVDPRFYTVYRGFEEPEKLAVQSRHVVNLFETPVLFYVICLVAELTAQSGLLTVGLAWVFVALRLMHSYVHMTHNIVLVRFRLFILSVSALTVLWATVLAGLITR